MGHQDWYKPRLPRAYRRILSEDQKKSLYQAWASKPRNTKWLVSANASTCAWMRLNLKVLKVLPAPGYDVPAEPLSRRPCMRIGVDQNFLEKLVLSWCPPPREKLGQDISKAAA